jgi:hypothetical protein
MNDETVKPEENPKVMSDLTDEELQGVQGGRAISLIARLPGGSPKSNTPGSIAQGDTISNNDNLPDAGGGVV